MLDLAEQIAGSPYADGLVAYTSVWDLIIAQSESNFFVGPDLRIQFDPEKQQFTFSFNESLFGHAGKKKAPLWTRTAAINEGFEVLERFLVKRARWFRKPVDAPEKSPSPSSA
jgi:hypothetical protein